MESKNRWLTFLLRAVSYLLVATVSAGAAFAIAQSSKDPGMRKLEQLYHLIDNRFIGDADPTQLYDMAAVGMVTGTGDRWSYYISAQDYAEYENHQNNEYVGVGITIQAREDGTGFDILQVEPGSSALEVGVLPGDILVEADGQPAAGMDIESLSQRIRGEKGTSVQVAVLRDGQRLAFTLERRALSVQVAKSQMLEGNIGYVQIDNFNANCAKETIAKVEELVEQGAQGLIFDVRFNGGGYKHELLEILDYLLPEGILFQTEEYTGAKQVDRSDADCLQLPMAVLVNGSSYSAAEFFAAALEEYDYAVVVGTPTSGKGYFQTTYVLADGSAVALSIGKYYTPKGVSLAETGGLTPGILVEVDEQTDAKIYSGLLDAAEDPQIQAALQALRTEE